MKGLGKMDLFFLSIKRSGQKKKQKEVADKCCCPVNSSLHGDGGLL